MITQLRFSLNDILSKPFTFIFTFIQITASLLLIAFSFSSISNLAEFKSKFDIFENSNNVYMIWDNTDDNYFNELMNNDIENTEAKVYELYSYINNMENIKTYSFIQDGINIDTNIDLYNVSPMDIYDDGENIFNTYDLIKVNENFINFYDLHCESGNLFSKSDYSQVKSETPVILGYNYKKHYEIGETINNEFIIVGFLEKDAFYLDPKSYGEVLTLNNSIIAPMIINTESHLLDIDYAIASTTIFTDDPKYLNDIKEKSDSLNVYDISFRSYSEQLNRITEDTLYQVTIMITIIFIILFFCIISFISTLLNFIETHKQEFSVHLLCGAIKSDFILRVLWQIASIILISDIIILIMFKFSYTFIFTLFVSIFILAITLLLPMIRINKLTINELLQRNE